MFNSKVWLHGLTSRVVAVAMTLPFFIEAYAQRPFNEVNEIGRSDLVLFNVSTGKVLSETRWQIFVGFQDSEFFRKRPDELAGGNMPRIKFGDLPKVRELLVSDFHGQAVREDDAEQCSCNSHSAADDGKLVVRHLSLRGWLFALGGGTAGIGIGLLIGRAWLLRMFKKPNV